ncbi:MAG: hypothetical protein DRQ44_02130 [Gammaproteobacteria bacterium]|nr:MAG: hypothetical protein DRQ44_02130 [Gammaproteobacteria bacterium]
MSSATYPVIKSIKSTVITSNANDRETSANGQAVQSPARSDIDKTTTFKESPEINNAQAATRSKTSEVEGDHAEASQLTDSIIENTDLTDIKNSHYFLKFAIPVALSFWFLDSAIHYFWLNELEFEIIPSDSNELWMRVSIFIMLASFGLFADFTSRKIIGKNNIINQAKIIRRAKEQWKLTVDSLPQLVIAVDYNARIIRINRTVETWGMGKVNKVDGLNVADFLKSFNENYTDDAWTADWPYIWQKIKKTGLVERKVENKYLDKTYQYTLRKISDYDGVSDDQCYAVLIINDITARQCVEESLKDHALTLEERVDERTKELKHANSQFELELQAKKAANKKLIESQRCRLALLRDIFTTQEKERKRIACELHDSIGQSLGATKFKLEELLINKQNIFDADYDEFTDVVKNLQSIIEETRHISMALRPSMLDDLGALVTLNWFCREFGNTYTSLSVNKIINVDESDISEDNKVVIFRIAQEAMNNIAKHAKATNIVLELSKSDTGMRMCISDNGNGFDIDCLKNKFINEVGNEINHPKCSFGLGSMRERAESTGGKFVIESTPGNGTSVIVSWENKETPSFAHS